MIIIKYYVPYPYQSTQYVKRILKRKEHPFRTHFFISNVKDVEHVPNVLFCIRERLLKTLRFFSLPGRQLVSEGMLEETSLRTGFGSTISTTGRNI